MFDKTRGIELCDECGHEMRFTDEPLTEDYKNHTYTVSGIKRWQCDFCGNNLMTAETATRLAKAHAKQYVIDEELLSPEQIKDIRKTLGLTQEQFEKVLGVSFPAASRWENGATVPSKTACILMKALRDEPLTRDVFLEMAGINKKSKKLTTNNKSELVSAR